MKTQSLWEAHVRKASSSPDNARQYKKYDYTLDPHRINAERIRAGEPVGDQWLGGRLKQELIDFHGMTEADFAPYYR